VTSVRRNKPLVQSKEWLVTSSKSVIFYAVKMAALAALIVE